MDYITDKELVKAIRAYVSNMMAGVKDDCYHWISPYAGVHLSSYGMSVRPGGYSLLWWPPSARDTPRTLILGMDFTFEVEDQYMNQLRDITVMALEEEGVDFIPLSHNAFGRLSVLSDSVRLVDRVGAQCVFSGVTRASTERQYFISGFDANETPPLYFLARLPHKVKTHQEAIESLKPESVKLAEKKGLEVLRQGDMFAIPTKFKTKDLTKMDATFADSGYLYGTAHQALNMACLPDGTQLGRGSLLHRPLHRHADHDDLPLPLDRWYLIVKNTVPVRPVS